MATRVIHACGQTEFDRTESRVAGAGGQWFTAPAEVVDGLYFPGYSTADAAADLGDSAICETAGLGGFAMAAAPTIAGFVGGDARTTLTATRQMYKISMQEAALYRIPSLDMRGSPFGIGPGPPGANEFLAFPLELRFCTALFCGRARRLTAQNGGFRPGQTAARWSTSGWPRSSTPASPTAR